MYFTHHLIREVFNLPNRIVPKNNNEISIVTPTSRLVDNAFYVLEYLLKKGSYNVNYLLFHDSKINEAKIKDFIIAVEDKYGIKPLFLRSKSGISRYYKSQWVFNDTYVPITKPLKNQIIVQLWHGYIGKRLGIINPTNKVDVSINLKFTTSVFTTTSSFLRLQFIAEFGIPWEKFVITSSPRFDRILNSRERAKKLLNDIGIDTSYKHLILAAPTFRKDKSNEIDMKASMNIIQKYTSKTFQKYLRDNDILLVIKPHPSLATHIKSRIFENNIALVDSTLLQSNLISISDILPAFDSLITDFSSVFVDYLLVDKPIIFFIPDASQAEGSLGYTVNFNLYTPGPKAYTVEELIKYVNSGLINKDEYQNQRECIRNILIEKYSPRNNTETLLKDIGFL